MPARFPSLYLGRVRTRFLHPMYVGPARARAQPTDWVSTFFGLASRRGRRAALHVIPAVAVAEHAGVLGGVVL